jgi:hypothetical protein
MNKQDSDLNTSSSVLDGSEAKSRYREFVLGVGQQRGHWRRERGAVLLEELREQHNQGTRTTQNRNS